MYNQFELERRMERVRVLLATHDEIYDSVSRNETGHSGLGDPVRRKLTCGSCGGSGCGQCLRSAAAAAELGVELKIGQVLVIERDPYDTGLEGSFDPGARTKRERAKLIDDTIEHLQEMELVRAGVYSEHVDHEEILARAEWRDEQGSYKELRRALECMPRGYRGNVAIRWIADWMPRTVKVPRWAYELEVERLEQQIREQHETGVLTVSEIAYYLGISKRQVRNAIRARSK